jgi:hypothetical protein
VVKEYLTIFEFVSDKLFQGIKIQFSAFGLPGYSNIMFLLNELTGTFRHEKRVFEKLKTTPAA